MIRVLLVDDQELVRSGFRIILESEADIEVVGEARNGVEAVTLAEELEPDVLCMDVEMPEMNGIEASRAITSRGWNAPAILILTTFGHDEYLFDALAAGVSGFLLKTARAEELVSAVRTLAAGDALLGPDVTRQVMLRAAQEAGRGGGATTGSGDNDGGAESNSGSGIVLSASACERAGLTSREREVLGLVAQGLSNTEIAETLFLGESTIKTHISRLLQKLGARDRVQLVVWVHTEGREI